MIEMGTLLMIEIFNELHFRILCGEVLVLD